MGDEMADDDFDEAVRRMLEQAEHADAPAEPSAEERARAARQADLARRLEEQAEFERQLAHRDRKHERTASRGSRRARWIAPLIVLAMIGAAIWFTTDRGQDAIAGGPEIARPSNWPPVAEDVSTTPLGAPPPAPQATGPYEFIATHDDDSPVTWDPCRPIHYVVNPAGQPEGGQELIEAAIAKASAATGLQFVADGTTDETWEKQRDPYLPDRYGERWAPVLISWSTEQETPPLGGYVAGLGGPASVGLSEDDVTNVSGDIVLDATDISAVLEGPGGAAAAQGIIQHEVGHLVGLDHVADPAQLMNTEGSPTSATDWGAGDLRGLHELGSGTCRPDI
ncbi:hypothetical protein [Dermatobacter hominis]|uniref:hypothetical protein n=1 Tax=Dermatobacter hominis TaxID=2884263 RepID=UPI001D10F994|nr:hypothetical protein [Dermatobacter hominis]UDY37937.1 hypothetical protein LH044_10420 [Dermatobacter hominis]